MRVAMMVFTLCQLVCLYCHAQEKEAELTPAFKEYFLRADIAQEEVFEKLKTNISDLEVAIRGEKNPTAKANLKRKLIASERTLEEAKDTKPNAFFFETAEVGVIGCIPPGSVSAVIDEKRAIITCPGHNIPLMVIVVPETKGLKAKTPFVNKQVWEVIAVEADDPRIDRISAGRKLAIVAPIKPGVVEKVRALYLADKKAKKDE